MFLFLSTMGMLSSGCLKPIFLFLLSSFFLLLFDVLNRFHESAFINKECFFKFFSSAFFSEIILALSLLFKLILLFCNELLFVGGWFVGGAGATVATPLLFSRFFALFNCS